MSNEQDMIVWKLQNDLARARLALARIHEVVGKVYYWDKGWAIDDLEIKYVEEIAKQSRSISTMAEAEWVDYDYECFQQAEDLRKIRLLNQDWEYLKRKGFIWRDYYGHARKERSISNRYLKNILNYCKTHYRPVEQVEALQNLWQDRINKQPLTLEEIENDRQS